eukprot:s1_g1449.t1
MVDEYWVPTRFVRDAFIRSGVKKPIRLVPPDLHVPEGVKSNKTQFGLQEDTHHILVALNLRSGLTRKNLSGNINAFVKAFGGRPGTPTLVLKLHDGDKLPKVRAEVNEMTRDIPNVVILDDDLDDRDMWCLIDSCDVVLSLHRAEGYGLLLKQGLLLGKQVIATNWSGNTDFMTAENSHLVPYELVPVADSKGLYGEMSDCFWADVDTDEAARILRTACEAL